MKTERRHELETNQLADSLGHWADRVRPYFNTILAGILVLVVALAVYLVAQRRAAAGTAAAWDEYFSAIGRSQPDRIKLEDLAESYAGTPVGWWSQCMAAELALNEGSNLLFRDKVLARELLKSAADRYEHVRGEAHEPALLKQAAFGLARAHECLGKIKEAEEEYQAIVKKWPDTPVALAAEQRAKDLKRLATREFYDWFAKQEIGKRFSPNSGMQGLKSPFNLDMLPDSPEQSGSPTDDDGTPGSSATPDDPAASATSVPPTSGPTSEATTDAAPADAAPKGAKDAGQQK